MVVGNTTKLIITNVLTVRKLTIRPSIINARNMLRVSGLRWSMARRNSGLSALSSSG